MELKEYYYSYYVLLDLSVKYVNSLRDRRESVESHKILDAINTLEKLYPESKKLIDEKYGRKDNTTY